MIQSSVPGFAFSSMSQRAFWRGTPSKTSVNRAGVVVVVDFAVDPEVPHAAKPSPAAPTTPPARTVRRLMGPDVTASHATAPFSIVGVASMRGLAFRGVAPLRKMSPRTRRTLAAGLRWARGLAAEIGMIGASDPEASAFGAFGSGSALLWPQGVMYNERYVRIGSETMVGPNTVISVGIAPGQVMPTDPVISIGDRTIIGRGSHIVGHWSIEIGDDIQTGPYVYITDQNHVYEDVDKPIGIQRPVEAAVSIGSGSWLGANVIILPGTHLGEHTTVAAGAVVSGTFPERVVLAGVPARIVKRWVPDEGWVSEHRGNPSGLA